MKMTKLNVKCDGLNPVNQDFYVLIAPKSVELFEVDGVEETTGLTKKAALRYPETPEDAYIYGLVNATASGDIFFFTNISRLSSELTKTGLAAIISYLGHEVYHLSRIIQARAVFGDSFLLDDWDLLAVETTEADTAELIEAIYLQIAPIFEAIYKIYT